MSDSAVVDGLSSVDFEGFIEGLIQGGWIEFFFPFLLMYAIVLTVMSKAEVFKENKAVRVIIALVFALFSVIFPVSSTCNIDVEKHLDYCTLGTYMAGLFPGVSLFAIGVLCLYIVAALLGQDLTTFLGDGQSNKPLLYILGGIGALIVGWQWLSAFFDIDSSSGFWGSDILQDPVLYILILFVLLFWWISRDDEEESSVFSKNGSGNVNVNIGGDER